MLTTIASIINVLNQNSSIEYRLTDKNNLSSPFQPPFVPLLFSNNKIKSSVSDVHQKITK